MLAQRITGRVDRRVRTAHVLNLSRYVGVIPIGVVTAGDADDFVPAASGSVARLIVSGMDTVHWLFPDKCRARAMVDYPGSHERRPR